MSDISLKIGLAGTKASGKGEIAEYLKSEGFIYYSLSDIVREEAGRRGLQNYTVKQLQDIGNDLREKHGLGVLAQMTLKKTEEGLYIIDGIRNLGEIDVLRNSGNFYLIGIDAPRKQRWQRLKARGRPSDPKTWEDFLAMDDRDLGVNEDNVGQQVYKCIKSCDYFIRNDSTIECLHNEVGKILSSIYIEQRDKLAAGSN